MKINFANYKPVLTKVSLSTPILTKNVCCKCVKGPSWYYFIREMDAYKHPHDLLKMYEWIQSKTKRFSLDFYSSDSPKHFTSIQNFNYQVLNKSFSCRAHKNKVGTNSNVAEFLSCECGSTVWALSTEAFNKFKPEITNRKSHKTFPQKFVF